MSSQKKLLILISFFLSVLGCSPAQCNLPVFEHIRAITSISNSSHFQLIDDFNSVDGPVVLRNKIESDWQTGGTEGAKTELLAEGEDANYRYGGSLAIAYEIPSKGTASVSALSRGLDVSRADCAFMFVRADEFKSFPGKVIFSVTDTQGKAASFDLRRFVKCKGKRWWGIAIPMQAFKALDVSQMNRFEIDLVNEKSAPVQGRFFVDEIGFFGEKDLVFKSAQDNLIGFPKKVVDEARRQELLKIKEDQKFVAAVAADTWRYFADLVDNQTHLPVDHIRIGESTGIGSYVSPTNIALYWMACVGAMDLSLISKDEAARRIKASLESLERFEKWDKGFYFNYYHTRSLAVTNRFVSSVDNGWLVAGLAIIRQAFPEEFGVEADKLLELMDFSKFYDPKNGQLVLGFDAEKNVFSRNHYGLLISEARLASYVAVGKGDLKERHWARIYHTLPKEWDWQRQVPVGKGAVSFGIPEFHGLYSYLDKQFVPSWGGSLFEFLAPTLVLDEMKLAPKSFGKNDEIATDLHIEYALRQKKYPVWGIAPCSVRNGRQWFYREYGIPEMGSKGYKDEGVIAPYATCLALATRPEAAVKNLRKMLELYSGIYGEYGFFDSVDLSNGQVNHQYLLLDQAMSFLAAVNDLKDGALRKRFHADAIGKKAEALLVEESFF